MVYSLVDSVNGFFSIDPVSGLVILEKPLDRESRDSYRVRVRATDQAGQQGALSTQVGGKSKPHRLNVSAHEICQKTGTYSEIMTENNTTNKMCL